MSTAGRTPECLAPETLAAFAEGRLTRSEIAPLLAHVEGCPRCMSAIASASHVLRERAQPRRWVFAAAAAIAAALLLLVPAIRSAISGWRSPMSRLVASAPRTERVIETRLTGGFDYAPYRGPARLGGAAADIERMKLTGLAGDLSDQANRDPSADSAHAAGIALLLVERPLEAVERLRTAVAKDPNDARNASDLAAALYAAARQLDRPSLYPQALDAADRALRTAPDSREALFNRALIIERMGLAPAAHEAWQRYLAVDPSSPWAAEARQRLAGLAHATGTSRFEHDRPRLETAAAGGDTATLATLVAAYPQQARTWSEFEYLTRWADAFTRGDAASGTALATARNIGDALDRRSGESLLRDAVRAIETADAQARMHIAEGQLRYKRGRVALSKGLPTEGERDLREAGNHFTSGQSPMALVARYFAAVARFERNDVTGATAELTSLLRESGAQPRYVAFGAQVCWQLALCRMYDGDWSGALALLVTARSAFDRLGERGHLGFIDALLATTQISLGQTDDAWASRIRAFEILSGEALGDRLAVSLGGAAQMEIRAGRLDSARALLALEEPFDRQARNDSLLVQLFVKRAVVSAALGDHDAAAHAHEARAIAAKITDPELRAQAAANASFAEGAASLPHDARRAREELTRAIDFYLASARPAFLPEAYLLRARASSLLGARQAALQDLDSGIDAAERHRVQYTGKVTGMGVIDAGPALLHESIRLRLDMGNVEEAFASAERIYTQVAPAATRPVPMDELQQRLAGSDTAVLAFAVLPQEVIAFCITPSGRSVARKPADAREVQALAGAIERGDAPVAATLYELLIRPSQPALASARSLIVVAAPPLDTIPFAALYDAHAKRYLIESWSVAMAPSAGALETAPATSLQTAVAIALPTATRNALHEGVAEVTEVTRLYPSGTSISHERASFPAFAAAAMGADVIHIASHTERDPATDELAFTFDGERVSWKMLTTLKLRPTATVLLAACETLQRARAPDARTLSLGGGFLAAGAADVVGTLAPIRDGEARSLFLDIHRHLASGERAADAVRGAQLAAIAFERSTGRHGAWRAVAVLTRRIAQRRTS